MYPRFDNGAYFIAGMLVAFVVICGVIAVAISLIGTRRK